ncbi:hypothetical protein EOD39_1704 [Acipenser ruthenus]|uniref:Uncharacterized protein n=1 Tax=Acipenser ruthenus TaxID=7906 RepID=A0A444U8W1_ACIRT|nr:hypothetical protein EOD39_1704 [Acipenser ruthenus]
MISLLYSRKVPESVLERLKEDKINPDDINSVATCPPTEEQIQEYLEARAAKDEEVFQTVKMQVEKAQERQKKQYRSWIKRGTKCFRIEVGMEVLKKNERKTGRLGSKLEHNWLGPYRPARVTNSNAEATPSAGQSDPSLARVTNSNAEATPSVGQSDPSLARVTNSNAEATPSVGQSDPSLARVINSNAEATLSAGQSEPSLTPTLQRTDGDDTDGVVPKKEKTGRLP